MRVRRLFIQGVMAVFVVILNFNIASAATYTLTAMYNVWGMWFTVDFESDDETLTYNEMVVGSFNYNAGSDSNNHQNIEGIIQVPDWTVDGVTLELSYEVGRDPYNEADNSWWLLKEGTSELPYRPGCFTYTITTTNPVPVPPAVWLLGSGLIGLVGIRKRRRA